LEFIDNGNRHFPALYTGDTRQSIASVKYCEGFQVVVEPNGLHTVFLATTHPETAYPNDLIDYRFNHLLEFAEAF
jgi:hypothetical protein